MRHAIERERASDHVRIAPQPRFPKAFRDDSDIRAFLFLQPKRPALSRAQPKHIEIIRGGLENRDLKWIAQSGHCRRQPIFGREPVENLLPIPEMIKPRRRQRKIHRLLLEMREHLDHPRRFLERQPFQKQVVDQRKDRRVEPDPERESNHRQEGKSRRFP